MALLVGVAFTGAVTGLAGIAAILEDGIVTWVVSWKTVS